VSGPGGPVFASNITTAYSYRADVIEYHSYAYRLSTCYTCSITARLIERNPVEAERTREQRLRRAAARQRLRLVKSKRKDPRAWDYGGFMLVDESTNGVILGAPPTGSNGIATLDEVEQYLTGEGGKR
jgi:hypothetical protein